MVLCSIVTNSASVAPSDHHQRELSPEYQLSQTPFPIYPVPVADYLHRCSILTLLVYLSCASHHLIAKSCFAMQPFLSVYPVYDSPCMTWTVYWTLILHRLPTLILPALFTDYPECLPPVPIQSLTPHYRRLR